MKFAKIIAWLGLLAMTAILIYGFSVGDFGKDGGLILQNPWGKVSLVDLYVGFVLFSAWIVFREKNWWIWLIWVIIMMVLGFFAASLYVLIALYKSKGDWLLFFLGSKKEKLFLNINKKGE